MSDVDPLLAPGSWVDARTPLAWIVRPGGWEVEALVAEADVPRIRVGGTATVIVAGRGLRLEGEVVAIDPARVQRLPHRLLAQSSGGPVAVLPPDRHGALPPAEALYRVVVRGEGAAGERLAVRRVSVHLEADAASPGLRWLSAAAAVLFRQGGF